MSYQSAEIARQQVLDYLNTQGQPEGGPHILAATNMPKITWQVCLASMITHGEIEKTGKLRSSRYRALVQTTMTAEAMQQHALNKRMAGSERAFERRLERQKPAPNGHRPAPKRENEPWRYVNRPDDKGHVRPTHQGGQGAIRRQVGIQASAGML